MILIYHDGVLIMVEDMDELARILKELDVSVGRDLRRKAVVIPSVRVVPPSPAVTPRPSQVEVLGCRLATMSYCDRSIPPHPMAVYDEEGGIILNDC